MTATAPPEEFSRPIDIDPGGRFAFEADAAECAALARRFALPAVLRLEGSGDLSPLGGGGVRLRAHYRAEVEQTCVVTLDPLRRTVEETLELTYVPESAKEIGSPPREIAVDPGRDDREILSGTVIDAGAAVAEHLALALDPYPRAPGAVAETAPGAGGDTHPFAALRALNTGA